MIAETNIKPFVNMNGSSKDDLRYQNMNVYHQLGNVRDMMAQATPHGRDYRNDEDYRKARAEHDANWKLIAEMMDRYEATIVHIIDA